ncbi:TPA: hypothetical protein L5F83_005818 [Pseudomonas aeruginosa]|nr:hypothetical protein [Pseudomonas aeruginosa]HBO9717197.1 hypothetical protein [Pseudomonas aeruginosa]HBO9723086.1 hypothetical protein [Pseudomonas aeruginosa]HBO9783682.1 hypothetical protein [Pseudomonas aeruginosa]HBO9813200.1 hypothetical protein [Pseudomonas aeruginosa]
MLAKTLKALLLLCLIQAARTVADPVKGRAPGSSEQLHRSGERKHGRSAPLNAPLKQPPLGSVGQLLRPALPSPRRQERDDKGRALGVALRVPRGSVPLGRRRRRCDRDRYPNGLRRTPVVGLVR